MHSQVSLQNSEVGDLNSKDEVLNSKVGGLHSDFITDFVAVDDSIQVSASGFGGGLTAGSAITADQFRLGSSALDASDRFIYKSSSGLLFFDVDGVGGTAQVLLADLIGDPIISNADIVVI